MTAAFSNSLLSPWAWEIAFGIPTTLFLFLRSAGRKSLVFSANICHFAPLRLVDTGSGRGSEFEPARAFNGYARDGLPDLASSKCHRVIQVRLPCPLSKLKCLCVWDGIPRFAQNDRADFAIVLPHRSHPLTCEIRKTYNLRGRLLRNGQTNISTQKAPPRSRPWLSFPLGHIRRPGRSAPKAVQGPPQAERLIPDA